MGRKKFNTLWCCMVSAVVLLALASGCSRQTKHKVLTFFFTGVPPLEEEKKPFKKIDPSGVQKMMAVKVTLYSHKPWAEGKCNQCHKNAASFGVPGHKNAPTVFHKGGGMPGKLILPKKELCIKCHDAMSRSKVYSKGLYLHPITAEGECDACHDPHQSKNTDMLLEKPEKICISCHLMGDALSPVEVCKSENCLSCHNPHMGKDRLLLTKDYTEMPQKVTLIGDQVSSLRSNELRSGKQESGTRDRGAASNPESLGTGKGPDVREQKSGTKDQGAEVPPGRLWASSSRGIN